MDDVTDKDILDRVLVLSEGEQEFHRDLLPLKALLALVAKGLVEGKDGGTSEFIFTAKAKKVIKNV